MNDNKRTNIILEHEFDVAKFLKKVKGSGAIVGDMIVENCELSCKKELRMIIHRLRESGLPICSNNQGYWIANTDEEILDTVAQLKGRAYSILGVAFRMQLHLVDQQEFEVGWWD